VTTHNLQRQIDCVVREIKMREIVYPSRVRLNKMKQETADDEIAAMKAVLATLIGYRAAQESKVQT
jgi:hypothetical protein